MSKTKLKVVDRGYAAFMKRGKALAHQPHTKVGVLGKTDARPPGDDLGNVELAVMLHFGDSLNRIPSRPFLELAIQKHGKQWGALLAKLAAAHVAGKIDLATMLGLVGERAAADVRAIITQGSGVPPPNAPSTIARKGSSRPLVDSGRLVQSISHEEVTPK